MSKPLPPDEAQRERIRHHLDVNLLVEAGDHVLLLSADVGG